MTEKRKYELDTPCLLLDKTKLDRNINRMGSILSHHHLALRPHVKTSKSVRVIQSALSGEKKGITVSTVKEAEYFFDNGFTDINYAVAITPDKMQRLGRLVNNGADIKLLVDSIISADMVCEKANAISSCFGILIEIDCDGHRAGIKPEDPQLTGIAKILSNNKYCDFSGVLAHAGSSYFCKSIEEVVACAEKERDAVVRSVQILQEAGFPCPVVSVGSSPTLLCGKSWDGVTEARAGVYMFEDLYQAGLGVCSVDDVALSVLTTVIGYNEKKNHVFVDAGWMALSRDRGTAKQKVDQGYGLVCRVFEQNIMEDILVIDAYQEHGVISHRHNEKISENMFPIGSQLRILPNHACATAAQHSEYAVTEGDRIINTWERCQGW